MGTPARQENYSWEASIESARNEIGQLLRRSPSHKSQLEEALSIAWRRARLVPKWGLDKRGWEGKFPTDCEWSLKDVLDNDFWPSQSIAGQW
jgi:Domain of unknown function DUF29